MRTYHEIERPDYTPEMISELKADEVFVFGSNLAGMHGGGAAYAAWKKFGAVMGCGVGLRGQSYAIPTMQGGVETIKPYVDEFIAFAKEHPERFFYVTRIGCGIAGFRDDEMAPLFRNAAGLKNVCLPESFVKYLTDRTVREATLQDMEAILKVFDAAREIMARSGNTGQWRNGYPSRESVLADLERSGGFVVEENGQVVAYFAFLPSPEPTYARIFGGEWLDDTLPYHVIHRIASFPDVHGIFSSIMDFCFSREHNIRIDTHRDNHIMQHNIQKHGFTYCGIIHLASGDERLAYQKITL